MSNRRYWDKLAVPPKTALKPIVAGRLKGKSDINPQWRIQAMTETFGPVGIGWTYSIDKLWTEPGSDGQVCAFAIVTVRVKDGEVWSEPVQGVGGAMLVEKERSGLYTSDEAFKMATTDALSVALKAFGVAAEVYLGNLDGSKYGRQPQTATSAPPAPVDLNKQHYMDIAAELKGAMTPADVDSIMQNRRAWLDAMPEAGRQKLNEMAMDILAKMEAA